MKATVRDKVHDMVSNKIALVTGASSGIGEALTRELISKSWVVVGIARRVEKLNAIKNEMGPSFIPITCDVSSKSDFYNACKNILGQGFFTNHFLFECWDGLRENY